MPRKDANQALLFPESDLRPSIHDKASSTFVNNMSLPVHRWFRFSAGFSAVWAESVMRDAADLAPVRVFDPFAGSATTLIAAEDVGLPSMGIDAHPFIGRIAEAKLARRSDREVFRSLAQRAIRSARRRKAQIDQYPTLIRKCYSHEALEQLDVLRQAVEHLYDDSPAARLTWLNLVGILRAVSHAGTAPWQYVLPRKTKKTVLAPFQAFLDLADTIYSDMRLSSAVDAPPAVFLTSDARTCEGVPDGFANLVVTSPPYPNNYDYADATRLEMTFMREIDGWGDLQDAVRKHLIRACSQHVPEKAVDLQSVLALPPVTPIREGLTQVCERLAEVRLTKGGKKTYHLMVACYFHDLGQVWQALRRTCTTPSRLCFVIGDSAPYGVYVPAIEWLSQLAVAAGFSDTSFERTRDRNVKWKNRKHRVPLCEGRLWVSG